MEEVFILIGTYLHDLFFTRLSSFPLYITSALLLTLLCVIGIVEVLIYIIIKRIAEFFEQRRDAHLKDRIITMLANTLVFSDDEDPKIVVKHFLPRFSRLPLYRSSIRKILVSELLKNHANFSGRAAEVLRELYLQLNLDKEARKNLSGIHSDKQIEAIRELTEMLVKEECEKFLEYTNSDNPELRLEAQAAYIRLCADNPFRFLDTVYQPILEWHQIILFEVITKTESMARPRFSYWLNSENDSIVLFSLRLIEYYQQFDAIPHLIYLINHYNINIRGAAIKILGRMEAETAEAHFIAVYPDQPLKTKVDILNALGSIASGNSLAFLNSHAKNKEFSVRMAAIRAIKMHRQNGAELLDTLYIEGGSQDKTIIKHVLNERITI